MTWLFHPQYPLNTMLGGQHSRSEQHQSTVQSVAQFLYKAVMLMTKAVGIWQNLTLGIKVQIMKLEINNCQIVRIRKTSIRMLWQPSPQPHPSWHMYNRMHTHTTFLLCRSLAPQIFCLLLKILPLTYRFVSHYVRIPQKSQAVPPLVSVHLQKYFICTVLCNHVTCLASVVH